MGYFYNK